MTRSQLRITREYLREFRRDRNLLSGVGNHGRCFRNLLDEGRRFAITSTISFRNTSLGHAGNQARCRRAPIALPLCRQALPRCRIDASLLITRGNPEECERYDCRDDEDACSREQWRGRIVTGLRHSTRSRTRRPTGSIAPGRLGRKLRCVQAAVRKIQQFNDRHHHAITRHHHPLNPPTLPDRNTPSATGRSLRISRRAILRLLHRARGPDAPSFRRGRACTRCRPRAPASSPR